MARKSNRRKPLLSGASARIRREISMEEELDEYSNIPLGRYQNVQNRQLKEAYREGYHAGRNSVARKPDIGRLRRSVERLDEEEQESRSRRGPRDMEAFRQGIRDVEERPRLGSRHESRLRGRRMR